MDIDLEFMINTTGEYGNRGDMHFVMLTLFSLSLFLSLSPSLAHAHTHKYSLVLRPSQRNIEKMGEPGDRDEEANNTNIHTHTQHIHLFPNSTHSLPSLTFGGINIST